MYASGSGNTFRLELFTGAASAVNFVSDLTLVHLLQQTHAIPTEISGTRLEICYIFEIYICQSRFYVSRKIYVMQTLDLT
jgi:hypothetical protein